MNSAICNCHCLTRYAMPPRPMVIIAITVFWRIWDCTRGARVEYVEQTYIQLLEQRYLPSLMNGLIRDLNIARQRAKKSSLCCA